MLKYITSAHRFELSAHVRAYVYNLVLIIMLRGRDPVLYMIREKHVILKVALQTRLAV